MIVMSLHRPSVSFQGKLPYSTQRILSDIKRSVTELAAFVHVYSLKTGFKPLLKVDSQGFS